MQFCISLKKSGRQHDCWRPLFIGTSKNRSERCSREFGRYIARLRNDVRMQADIPFRRVEKRNRTEHGVLACKRTPLRGRGAMPLEFTATPVSIAGPRLSRA